MSLQYDISLQLASIDVFEKCGAPPFPSFEDLEQLATTIQQISGVAAPEIVRPEKGRILHTCHGQPPSKIRKYCTHAQKAERL